MRAIKRIWNFFNTLLVAAVVLLAIALVGVRLVGLTPYAVLSGSMEPTYHVGALIYVKDIAPEEVEVGTPLTFIVNEELLIATHRVVDIAVAETKMETVLDEAGNPVLDENGNEVKQEVPLEEPVYYFQTKGDANDDVDGSLVHHKNVVGTPVFSIPYLGYLSRYAGVFDPVPRLSVQLAADQKGHDHGHQHCAGGADPDLPAGPAQRCGRFDEKAQKEAQKEAPRAETGRMRRMYGEEPYITK